jgi:hypothetical protein
MIWTAAACTGWLLLANAVPDPPGFTRALFDGRTLAGWTIEGDAEADVVDGCLRLKAGNGWLRSDAQYRDFRLHVEWQALQEEAYDAGIYLRTRAGGTPFPKEAYQVNLLQGKEGHINPLPDARTTGLVKPARQWNAFDLLVIGSTVTLWINDQLAYAVDGLTRPQGYLGFQIEVPTGGQFLLQNIRVTEFGHQSLFNGRDLDGWEGGDGDAAACWSVQDGELVCSGHKGPWLRSRQEYGDFNLRLDYLVSPGGNSGVYVRVPKDGNHHRDRQDQPPAGFEVQILDDADRQYASLKDYQYSASIYDLAGAQPRVSRPAGEWNTLEINCQGQQVITIHNGRIVTNITDANTPALALRSVQGYLGLQNHSTVVRLKNLRLGPPLSY